MNIQLLISVSAFLITVGTFVWRLSALHQQCMANKESAARAHERINKLEDVQNNKIEELSNQLHALKEGQIRMEEKINLIIQYEKKQKPNRRGNT